MRLTPEARAAVDAAIADAHEDGRPTREIAARVVTAMHEMEPSGLPWVSTFLDDLAIAGAVKLCADWRRKHRVRSRTRKGTETELPAYVGANDEDGNAVQLSLIGLDLAGLTRHRARLARQRDTLSVEVAALDVLIRQMEADPSLETVGAAIAALGVAA